VRLLLSKGHSCYRPRRDGERKRKSVRGCIVDSNLSVLALVIVKKGEQVWLISFIAINNCCVYIYKVVNNMKILLYYVGLGITSTVFH
jgi:hypothetical protein